MNIDQNKAVFDELDELLDEERTALITGDLEKVARLLERKENLLDAMSGMTTYDAEYLEAASLKLERNRELLDGALEGIRAVSKRLATLRRIRSTLETYDSSGSKQTIEFPSDSAVEKRA